MISLYQKMEIRRIPCDSYTMNILIHCFCSCSQVSFALSTLAKITKLGFQPDIVTFNTLLRGLCLAWDLFCSLPRNGVEPDVQTYTIMIYGFCGKGAVSEANALFQKMWSTLIRGRLRASEIAASTALIKEMRSNGSVQLHPPLEW